MPIFTKSWLSGLGRDQSNTWDNIVLQWVEDNWTLNKPAKYHPTTNPHGVLFGSEYFGHWDFLCYTSIGEAGEGIKHDVMSIGGRHEKNTVDVTFCFSCRKYNVFPDELPEEVTNVVEFVKNLVETNPRGLQNEGIRYMSVGPINDGEIQVFGQQIYEIEIIIKCLVSRINLE